jgi:hypothetical protein
MTNNLIHKKNILEFRAIPDIVNDPVTVGPFNHAVGNQADMIKIPRKLLHDNISGKIVAASSGYRNLFTLSFKPGLEVGYSAEINIPVRFLKAPFLGIVIEVPFHISMNKQLQIDTKAPSILFNEGTDSPSQKTGRSRSLFIRFFPVMRLVP